MLNILFAAKSEKWTEYEAPLKEAFAAHGLEVTLSTDMAADVVDYIIYAPNSGLDDFTPFTHCKAVLNLWAGVEDVVGNPTLTMPLARMVDPGLTEGMVEYVTGHVLRHHLGMDAHITNPDRAWIDTPPPLARDRKVAILGLGALGSACASALAALNFDVHGWSRSAKDVTGVTCHAGDAGLMSAVDGAHFIVLLMPLTPETENLISTDVMCRFAPGACLINPGRGPLIDDEALLAALDTGEVAHATLDVFRTEPLPPEHPFWSDPKITVTPHIASTTRPASAARTIAANIAGHERGEPLRNLVDRGKGY
ncbi:MAG: glyoxylate/hydroxypyruvate reductase A [Pseudomonadota bacterium]